MWYRYTYERTTPRKVKSGIKSRSKRGAFGETWWGKRWIEVLESFHTPSRLQRGRRYARAGQVAAIDIRKVSVHAKVQGSRTKPYDVIIKVKPFSVTVWKKLAKAIKNDTFVAAKLCTGVMPEELEKLSDKMGIHLLPKKLSDIHTQCSCPDWSNPCKHIAATYYLLSEEFDRDPFLLFRLRGIEREEFINMLGVQNTKNEILRDTQIPEVLPSDPLTTDPKIFWNIGILPEEDRQDCMETSQLAALPKRLGTLPFWRGKTAFQDAMEQCYKEGTQNGKDILSSMIGCD